MIPPLYANQRQTIEFAHGQPAVYDASDPGTGKTRSSIEIFRPRLHIDNRAVLVLADGARRLRDKIAEASNTPRLLRSSIRLRTMESSSSSPC